VKRQRAAGPWTIAAMIQDGFLTAWLPKLAAGERCEFVSATSADELGELCQRAEDAISCEEFTEVFVAADMQQQRLRRLQRAWNNVSVPDCYEYLQLVAVRTMDEPAMELLVR